jgi:hypothetical protein
MLSVDFGSDILPRVGSRNAPFLGIGAWLELTIFHLLITSNNRGSVKLHLLQLTTLPRPRGSVISQDSPLSTDIFEVES